MESRDLREIVTMCAFLEDAAESARSDRGIGTLLHLEVGKWLGWAANEDALTPWLGSETKRLCGYVPGLAEQCRQLKTEQDAKGPISRLLTLLANIFRRLIHLSD